ncbi:MAG: ABC transporter permease [Anaerolineales bacterium]|nr:ABC transporter permease [Anaerolineales bacterium]
MSLRRIFVLLKNELFYGSKNVIFVMALVVPILFTIIVSLLFGTIFSGKPRLGLVDPAGSQFGQIVQEADYLLITTYADATELRDATERGAVDMGLVIPAGFDDAVESGNATVDLFIWGESLIRNRTAIAAALGNATIKLTGAETAVDLVTTTLGDAVNIPWEKRLFPFIVLITLLLGSMMVPATSIVEEKQHRTLQALITTPTSLGELLVAKAILGVGVSVVMGVAILVMNRALGEHPWLLILLLVLGAILGAAGGILLGIFAKDINTLFATIKGLGILLYAPAIIYLFPTVPQWIGRLFPTYYIIAPITEITQNGAGWSVIADEVIILLVLILALIGIVAYVVNLAGKRDTILAV